MKLIRFKTDAASAEFGAIQENGTVSRLSGDLEIGFTPTGETVSNFQTFPLIDPPSIYCVGANYRYHIEECGGGKVPEFPIIFMKGPNTLQVNGGPIVLPKVCSPTEVDYEGELAVVIGRACRDVSREEALSHVAGYACANDVTARDWQLKLGGTQWCRGKGFDTFLPLGPHLVTPDEIPNPNELQLRTWLNGDLVQDWNTNDMVFDVPAIIEFLSQDTTLLPGTVILTGTPHGVGMAQNPPRWLRHGDTMTVEIAGIGRLTNPVQDTY